MSMRLMKRPKPENVDDETSSSGSDVADEGVGFSSKKEQEETLLALIEHRAKEVDHLKLRVTYYRNQLAEAEKRLQESQSKLSRLRAQDNTPSSKSGIVNKSTTLIGLRDLWQIGGEANRVKEEPESGSPATAVSSINGSLSKSELLIPCSNLKLSRQLTSEMMRLEKNGAKIPVSCNTQASLPASDDIVDKPKAAKPSNDLDIQVVEMRGRKTKRKLEENEREELVQLIGRSSSPCEIGCHTSNQISSQHKRKLRSLALCPVDDELFVTSALDGVVNLWQLRSNGLTASLLSSTDCLSPKERRWPEDITWHPCANSLFAVYSADGGDFQVSIIHLDKRQEPCRVTFLEDKPHTKGVINGITFMPWKDTCFATGGSDHAVVLWNERDGNSWEPKRLHGYLHSSAVNGVVGLEHRHLVISVGADKRIIGFDVEDGKMDFKHQIESRCMSALPNPCDHNLFMLQTAQPEKQLRLYDIRIPKTELHSFGWKQESSVLQSALIRQSWSPDGFYITSGSADPMIHIFDIRYNSQKPFLSVKAHKRRVFKAEWHRSLSLLVSISSDLNIMLHKVS